MPGQSLPDWLAMRVAILASFRDGVAFPENAADILNAIGLGEAV